MVETPPVTTNNRRDERADESYAVELWDLQVERDEIIEDASRKKTKLFPHLEVQLQLRMKIANDYRDLQLKNIYNHYKSEVQQAWNEFERGKRQLQSGMLEVAAERRRRLDTIRHSISNTNNNNNNNMITNTTTTATTATTTTTTAVAVAAAAASIISSGANGGPNAATATVTGGGSGSGSGSAGVGAMMHIKKRRRGKNSHNNNNNGVTMTTTTGGNMMSTSSAAAVMAAAAAAAAANFSGSRLVGGATTTNQMGAKPEPFIASLEGQGLVRVGLTPDEVNSDLEGILKANELSKTNGYGGNGTHNNNDNKTTVAVANHHQHHHHHHHHHQHQTPMTGTTTSGGGGGGGTGNLSPDGGMVIVPKSAMEKVHISKGTLHYHDYTYEKGDRVAVFNNARPKATMKYEGTLASINAREIIIRSGTGAGSTPHRMLVSHLSSGRYMLKRL